MMTSDHPTYGNLPPSSSISHPLEPLTADEIITVVHIVRTERQLAEHVRFVSVNLHEPDKKVVLQFQPGQTWSREAFIILLDSQDGATYEAIVSLTSRQVTSWRHIPGVQPSIMPDELAACENLLKAHPDFQAALHKRGITNTALVMVDTWSAGYYGDKEDNKRRLLRSLAYMRSDPNDNAYAHPVEGIIAYVDLNKQEVVRVEDHGVIPIPPESGSYFPEAVGMMRTDMRPLDITQPEGPSFTVNGHEIYWQKWRFRISFNTREGLVLHTVGYEDQGRLRPILYRTSLAEMVVPYGDPSESHARKNAFDVGEYGVGMLANPLELGCDCLGHIHYFDAFMTDSRGELVQLPRAICMHEEDYGILWKHYDWRLNRAEVRRSRRLVISFIATIDNYEYGFFWYFYQDGTIQFEVKLTGIMSTGAVSPREKPKYGQLVAPQLSAPIHQHIFCIRMDMMVDGPQNSIYEIHTETESSGPNNPYGNAFFARSTLLKKETEAQQVIDPLRSRYWTVINPHCMNSIGEPVGYKLLPGENTLPYMHPSSSIMQRAGFTQKHLWVTPYHAEERYPAGDYPNQHRGGEGLPAWTQADRSIEDTNIVVWYVMNVHHVPRVEDWPVMPVNYISFMLKPTGFFDRNPALDVPTLHSHQDSCSEHS